MTDVIKNGLAYFFQGVKDCLNGFYKLYELKKTSNKEIEADAVSKKPLSVLEQRRAANRTPTVRKTQ